MAAVRVPHPPSQHVAVDPERAIVALVDALTVLHESADAYSQPAGCPLSAAAETGRRAQGQHRGNQRRACSTGGSLLDLEYSEDKDAEVDFNVVMTGFRSLCRGTGWRRRGDVCPGPTGTACSTWPAAGLRP